MLVAAAESLTEGAFRAPRAEPSPVTTSAAGALELGAKFFVSPRITAMTLLFLSVGRMGRRGLLVPGAAAPGLMTEDREACHASNVTAAPEEAASTGGR